MRAVIQRVRACEVTVEGQSVGRIDRGLLVYLGIGKDDTRSDADYLAEKTAHLRIYQDADGKMNLSVLDVGGQVLVVSQFTLLGDVRGGRRPSYTAAADPDIAKGLYESYMEELRGRGVTVQSGRFAASMEVAYVNCGPVTILADSRKTF